MSMMTAPYLPGVVTDDTALASAGHATDSDGVRIVRGRFQTQGGYVDAANGFRVQGAARGLHQWVSIAGENMVAIGTNSKLYVLNDGTVYDITPIRSSGTLGTNPFSTNAGSATVTVTHAGHGLVLGDTALFGGATPVGGLQIGGGAGTYGLNSFVVAENSSIFTVNHVGHGLATGDLVTISGASAVGGITLAGAYGIAVVDADSYFIDSGTLSSASAQGGGTPTWKAAKPYVVTPVDTATYEITAGSPAASSASGGGASVSFAYEIHVGPQDGSLPGGFGTGPYGVGPYGVSPDPATIADFLPRTWSMDHWGENLVANPLGGAVYQWDVNFSKRAEVLTNAPAHCYAILVTAERYMIAMGCTMTDGTFDPLGVRWCDNQDNTDWVATQANTAGQTRLGAGGSYIVSARVSHYGFLVWTDNSLHIATPTGTIDQVYDLEVVASGCGLMAPQAAVDRDGQCWWLSPSGGVYSYSGGLPQPTQCPVRSTLYVGLSPAQQWKAWAYWDQQYPAVTFGVAKASDRDGNPSREINTYARLDVLEQRDPNTGWSVGSTAFTTACEQGTLPGPIAIRTDGMVCQLETGSSAAGAPLKRFIRFAPQQLNAEEGTSGNRVMNINRIVLDAEIQGTLSYTLSTQRWLDTPLLVQDSISFTPAKLRSRIRGQGRQKVDYYESVGTSDFWRLGVPSFDLSPGPPR